MVTNQEESVEFFITLDMIGHYFTKGLQGYQYHFCFNITHGLHDDDILSYNESRRGFLDEKNLKLKFYK